MLAALRRFVERVSSQGVFKGDLRNGARLGTTVSSSNVRLTTVFAGIGLIATGCTGVSEVTAGAVVAFGGTGARGAIGAVTIGVVPGEAEADTGVVCGSLGPLRNGLNSHEGASFDKLDLAGLDVVGALESLDSVERTEWIEACEGEVLRPVAIAGVSIFPVEVSSGRSLIIRLGLSSIVVILLEPVKARFLFSESREGGAGAVLAEGGTT